MFTQMRLFGLWFLTLWLRFRSAPTAADVVNSLLFSTCSYDGTFSFASSAGRRLCKPVQDVAVVKSLDFSNASNDAVPTGYFLCITQSRMRPLSAPVNYQIARGLAIVIRTTFGRSFFLKSRIKQLPFISQLRISISAAGTIHAGLYAVAFFFKSIFNDALHRESGRL